MDYMSRLKSWNLLKQYLDKITDSKTKKLYHDSLLLKAIEEWGFNPEKPESIKKTETVELNDCEKNLIKRINAYKEYGIDIQTTEEKEQLDKDFKLSMWEFVREGGKLDDLPDNLRHSRCIIDAYFQMKEKLYIA